MFNIAKLEDGVITIRRINAEHPELLVGAYVLASAYSGATISYYSPKPDVCRKIVRTIPGNWRRVLRGDGGYNWVLKDGNLEVEINGAEPAPKQLKPYEDEPLYLPPEPEVLNPEDLRDEPAVDMVGIAESVLGVKGA